MAADTPPLLPWQMLEADLHMETLGHDFAPTGLLEMIAQPPQRVLDVGCFCGGTGAWLKSRFPHCEVIGIEFLQKAADIAATRCDRVIRRPIEEVDFSVEGIAPGSLDAIVAADVLEHIYNPWKQLQRFLPLLAPGGAIYISLPNIRNLTILGGLAKGEWRYAGAGILDITHIRFFTRAQSLEMLRQTGWNPQEVRINPDPRLMPFLQGRKLEDVTTLSVDRLTLNNLTRDDVLELMALQFFIRATPAT